jgi:CRP-like cAMP-binding protein
MPRPDAPPSVPPTNRLLAALSAREYRRLAPHLETVPLTPKAILHESDQDVDYVYFPTSGIVSLLSRPDGQTGSIEVGIVGREGMAGLPAFLGVGMSGLRTIVQMAGEALRLRAEMIPRVADHGSTLHVLLLRYTHVFLTQVAQGAACSSLHPIEKRLCRWLLSVQDRAGMNHFPLTHEFLATMLGVRRASVTEVARRLRRAGLIRYGGGVLTVEDRSGLEAAACSCYRMVQAEMERVLV